ncbi:MAG TPA: hypothetical protein VJU87_09310 [Gemmatimonadaceae bacterium]|nr:hypothetical protein [Gemmatimonadaceae bacterium]
MEHVDRYVPANTNAGWGYAILVILIAVACIVTVTIIHRKTYLHPQNVTWHAKGPPEELPPQLQPRPQ